MRYMACIPGCYTVKQVQDEFFPLIWNDCTERWQHLTNKRTRRYIFFLSATEAWTFVYNRYIA